MPKIAWLRHVSWKTPLGNAFATRSPLALRNFWMEPFSEHEFQLKENSIRYSFFFTEWNIHRRRPNIKPQMGKVPGRPQGNRSLNRRNTMQTIYKCSHNWQWNQTSFSAYIKHKMSYCQTSLIKISPIHSCKYHLISVKSF